MSHYNQSLGRINNMSKFYTAIITLILLGMLNCTNSYATSNISYKNYLYTHNDEYSCDNLKQYRCGNQNSNQLDCVNDMAIRVCQSIKNLHTGNMALNDSYNTYIASTEGKKLPDITRVQTLFAPYVMTYDPDYPNKEKIGKPVTNLAVQQTGYQKILNKQPSCVEYRDNYTLQRFSPYTSHCSAYTALIADKIFGINIYPVQIGDWCHVAAEQRDRLYFDLANWTQVNSIDAQKNANQGKLVIAVFKKVSTASPLHQQNGHISIVIPNVTGLATKLQLGKNYPKTPVVSDTYSFETLIKLYGPETTQAGGLNFNNTVTANAFSSYYANKEEVGKLPVDKIIEFFVYKHRTQLDY